MVKSFRVAELKQLLQFADLTTTGYKIDLMLRALKLLKYNHSPKVLRKIRELYANRFKSINFY